jgi:hypothetical protein
MKSKKEKTCTTKGEIYVKTYKSQGVTMVAACDAELIDKKLKADTIEFYVSKEFYAGILGNKDMLKKHLEVATIANLIGQKTVRCGIEMGLINEKCVIEIAGIPHAQFALL